MKRALITLMTACLVVCVGNAIFPNVAEPEFRAVGRMGNWDGSNFSIGGSATAISPYWVIGVSHVGGNTFEQDGIKYQVLQKINDGNVDLAVYRVQGPLKYAMPIAFRPFSGGNGLSGLVTKLVGWGRTGVRNGNTGWTIQGGTENVKRSGPNVIDAFFPDVQVQVGQNIKTSDCLAYDLDDPQGQNPINVLGGASVAGEGGVANFDSGGGWFVMDGGLWRLVANSAYVGTLEGSGVQGNFDFGAVGLGIYLNSYRAWIEATVPDLGRAILDAVRLEFGSTVLSGTLTDVEQSDNVRLALQSPNLVSSENFIPFGVAFSGKTTAVPATALDITIEGRSNASGSAVQVALKNWNSGLYEGVHAYLLPVIEATETKTNISAANYVGPNGEVDLRIRVLSFNDDIVFLRPSFDKVMIVAR